MRCWAFSAREEKKIRPLTAGLTGELGAADKRPLPESQTEPSPEAGVRAPPRPRGMCSGGTRALR